MKVRAWEDIRSEFTDAVVVGNGASIAVDPRFQYRSLHDAARNAGLLTRPVTDVFTYFPTTDFEFVLRSLSSAHAINKILKIKDATTAPTYKTVKDALIKIIQRVHPEHASVRSDLVAISKFLRHFDTVFSLNYDMIVYWGMLRGNEKFGANRLKDCFVAAKNRFEYDCEWLRKPYGAHSRATLVFYPHGSLFLGVDAFGVEQKIISDTRKLVDVIEQKWSVGGLSPLFVSEGTATAKLHAIRRNGYLNYVYSEEIPRRRESLAIYGWSMSEQDQHVLDALAKSRPKRVAVSFHGTNPAPQSLQRVKQTFNISDQNIVFFKADDKRAWKY
jgi:hypothetical protein